MYHFSPGSFILYLQNEFSYEEASNIVKVCAKSPLAISVISNLLKEKKYTPMRLLQHLELVGKNVTKGLGVNECLKVAIDKLSHIEQSALVGLSVFQSSPCLIKDALDVLTSLKLCDSDEKDIVTKLINCHLVLQEDMDRDDDSYKVSLHPLVYQYIQEWKKDKDLLLVLRKATETFVSLFEGTIGHIVRSMSTTYQKAWQKLDDQHVHIMKYYDIMADQKDILPPHPKSTSEKAFLMKKRVSDLADILLSNAKKRRLFKVNGQEFYTNTHLPLFYFLKCLLHFKHFYTFPSVHNVHKHKQTA